MFIEMIIIIIDRFPFFVECKQFANMNTEQVPIEYLSIKKSGNVVTF